MAMIETPQTDGPLFKDVSVHDPSVINVDGTYYVFGSHLAVAKTDDLISWELIGSGVNSSNPVIPNAREEMAEAFEWAKTETFWAPDTIQLADGRFYHYYCTCKGDSPLSSLGVAVSDNVDGPYKDLGIFLKSGMAGKSEDGTNYNASIHPNAVDPHAFFDNDGKLWMVYGSYSGGIYIMEMDPETGFPYEGQGYGKMLLGKNHSRIEGPYMLYSPETEYYYLFLSFGGLGANDGYNMRVARSKTPDGPYYDAKGQDMINCGGPSGTFFNDAAIEKYGVKIMGNYQFKKYDGENASLTRGYKSPGHNSAYYDAESGKYFLIFHTRLTTGGEGHSVRVHQLFFSDKGWPMVSPHRYAGETLESYELGEIIGSYKLIEHVTDITGDVKYSKLIKLYSTGEILGEAQGIWEYDAQSSKITLTIEGETYQGTALRQWDFDNRQYVMTFTALSDEGLAIFGSKLGVKLN